MNQPVTATSTDPGRPLLLAAATEVDAAVGSGPGWVLVRDGLIAARSVDGAPLPQDVLRVDVDRITPGLVDTHVHGALGVDFTELGVDPQAAIDHHHAAGATTLLASMATAAHEVTTARLRELSAFVGSGAIAGIHLEGPWLSPERRGAHSVDLLTSPGARDVEDLLEAADGGLRMVTLAPELPGALAATAALVAAGVVVAIGHTDASADVVAEAVDAGATVVTHLFNGMPPLHHREPGTVGVALGDDRLTLELIADGEHVDDRVIDLVLGSAGSRVSLVSDAMAATGLGDGRYLLAGSEVDVAGGVARLAHGSSLAGSTTTLGAAVARLLARGVGLGLLARAATVTPAAALGLDVPRLRVGDRADLVAWAPDGRRHVMRGGRWLTQAPGSTH